MSELPLAPVALEELKKLTVPQLKALCKERRVVGYSKLGKPAIIQKLINLNSNGVSTTAPTVSSAAVTPSLETPNLTEAIASTRKPADAVAVKGLQPQAQQPVSSNGPTHNSSPTLPTTTSNQPSSSALKLTQDITNNPEGTTKGKKRLASTASGSVEPPLKRLKTAQAPSTTSGLGLASGPDSTPSLTAYASSSATPKVSDLPVEKSKKPRTLLSTTSQTPSKAISQKLKPAQSTQRPNAVFKVPGLPTSEVIPPVVSKTLHLVRSVEPVSLVNKVSATMPSGKRFVPLTVKKLPTSSPKGPVNAVANPPANVNASRISDLYSLAFPVSQCLLSLVPITRPPSLSQRKLVPRWSILLSGLGVGEIRQCTQVSRMFRYAGTFIYLFLSTSFSWPDSVFSVYLSAVQRLALNFGGRRLAVFIQEYPQNRTNMWPYLRFRELELSSRKARYEQSFLARYFTSSNPISAHLWTSPDHERQITVAVR